MPRLRPCYVLAVLAAAACHGAASGMPPYPGPIVVTQPDGSEIALRLAGNEGGQVWETDLNGYPVERQNGTFVYVLPAAARAAAAAPLVVGKADPAAAGVQKGMVPPRPGVAAAVPVDQFAPPAGASPEQRIAPTGTVKNIVILMRFSNHAARALPSPADISKLFNAENGDPVMAPTGSVRDVYKANSYGTFTLDSSVFTWVDLPNTELFYSGSTSGERAQQMIRDALNLADPQINFADFDKDNDGFVDAITFLHSGYGAEFGGFDSSGAHFTNRMWSHKSAISTWTSAEGVKVSPYHVSPALWSTSGSEPGRIGVICHETGHFFGLPDLYDGTGGAGVGAWCMMGNSWGFDGSQLFPPHFSAWSKIRLGWVTPTELTASGIYTAPASATTPTVFKISAGYPDGEYLLIENRQPTKFDQKIPAGTGGTGGLAIWHIDDKKGQIPMNNVNTDRGFPGQPGFPTNGKHYGIALLQADGKFDLEKNVNRGDGNDVYRAGFQTALTSTTVPNTKGYQGGNVVSPINDITEISASGPTMTFRYFNGTPPPPDNGNGNGTGVKAELLKQIQALELKQAETATLIAALKAKVESMPTAPAPAAAPAAARQPYDPKKNK